MRFTTLLASLSLAPGAALIPQSPAQAAEYKLDRTKLTVGGKPIGAAIKAEAKTGQRTAAVKKALAD